MFVHCYNQFGFGIVYNIGVKIDIRGTEYKKPKRGYAPLLQPQVCDKL